MRTAMTDLMVARGQESQRIVELVNSGEDLAKAAAWYLKEGTEEAREALAGAASAWEAL